jgi:small-conductance mechanosensitive channel
VDDGVIGILRPFLPFVPAAGTLVLLIAGLFLAHRFLERVSLDRGRGRFRNQLIMLGLSAVGVVVWLLVLPLGPELRGQLIGFFGIVISAAIALSSTTFLGNAMAGVLLRVVRNFRVGDFVACGEHFGRVTERGLFHTEVQNEHRELITLPNLYLVTHPVTTTRTSGTVVSATVSLGYDVDRVRIETALLAAAGDAGLREPFVHVLDLGDHSVTYKVAGLLDEVKQLLSARSRLRCAAVDRLHGAGIEIVSPSFMNQRPLDPSRPVVPPPRDAVPPASEEGPGSGVESIVFDKADEAESIEQLKVRLKDVLARIKALQDERGAAEGDEARDALDRRLDAARKIEARIRELIDRRSEHTDSER